ncbi:hypothetical protein BU23DRAFT_563537 [Bimuria novae-zelandiae CBS 107.79]|uniref:Uncharacterized protein n=1 Tax=Bimuria novae-zelandiae CBS 107.79 TaxID=1447943 RepID=A0A6A5VUF2_9PLEO|nr:hypothetical protein BU23DRAFT_563537 [Bimuria novae-zelandiae CBS 107.79]
MMLFTLLLALFPLLLDQMATAVPVAGVDVLPISHLFPIANGRELSGVVYSDDPVHQCQNTTNVWSGHGILSARPLAIASCYMYPVPDYQSLDEDGKRPIFLRYGINKDPRSFLRSRKHTLAWALPADLETGNASLWSCGSKAPGAAFLEINAALAVI